LSAQGTWDERDGASLMAALHGELEEALGKKLPQPLWHQVIRERRATFSCRPDLPRPTAKTPLRGLWLAGDYVCADYPATLEGAVRSGVAAARGVLAEMNNSPL
jgi:hydroxysqualene dehydroxylase